MIYNFLPGCQFSLWFSSFTQISIMALAKFVGFDASSNDCSVDINNFWSQNKSLSFTIMMQPWTVTMLLQKIENACSRKEWQSKPLIIHDWKAATVSIKQETWIFSSKFWTTIAKLRVAVSSLQFVLNRFSVLLFCIDQSVCVMSEWKLLLVLIGLNVLISVYCWVARYNGHFRSQLELEEKWSHLSLYSVTK